MALFHSDTVFAGDRTADDNANFDDFCRQLFRAFQFTRSITVKQDQRVQVAIAGMKDVGNAQSG